MSETDIVIETLRRRWVEEPDRSTPDRVCLFWTDGHAWVRLPLSRSLIGEPEFPLHTYLDEQADREWEAANKRELG